MRGRLRMLAHAEGRCHGRRQRGAACAVFRFASRAWPSPWSRWRLLCILPGRSRIRRSAVRGKALAEARTLNLEMQAVWDYIDDSQPLINVNDDGSYSFKGVYCSVAGKAIAKRFTRDSEGYVIRYVRRIRVRAPTFPDEFEAEALARFEEGAAIRALRGVLCGRAAGVPLRLPARSQAELPAVPRRAGRGTRRDGLSQRGYERRRSGGLASAWSFRSEATRPRRIPSLRSRSRSSSACHGHCRGWGFRFAAVGGASA